MLCKVVRGQPATEIQPIGWSPHNHAGAAPVFTSQPPRSSATTSSGAANRESQLAELQQQMELSARQAFQEGRVEGERAAEQRANARVEEERRRLRPLLDELAACRSRVRREAEQDLVQLAVAIARRILRREVSVDPEALQGLVKAAFERLDLRECIRVRVSPEAAAVMQAAAAQSGLPPRVELVADPALEPGGVIVETTRGSLDASVETQLEEIGRGLTDLLVKRR